MSRSLASRASLLVVLVIIATTTMGHTTKPKYSRALYKHWIDEDGDCQDARVEVLVRDVAPGSIRFADTRACTVELGRWPDPYTGNIVTVPTGLDVDHIVPLKHAHDAGGWRWSAEKRREYANDLRYRRHLMAVSASANRAKGDKGPDRWRPENREFWCQYAEAWATVKFVWGLSSTETEREAVREMLMTC